MAIGRHARRSLVLRALSLALLVAGCAAGRPPGPALPALSAEELQRVLAERRQALRSLRSEASVAVYSPEQSGKAKQFLVVERPDRLRLEVFSPFGAVFALATANGDLAAWVRDENRVYRGPATPENLARYAGLDLQVADVVDVVLGSPPRRAVRAASVFAETSTRLLRLRQETEGGAQVVLFGGEPLLPVEVQEVDSDGELLWRASFADYRSVQDIALPTRIDVDLPRSEQRAEIVLSDPEPNPSLSESIFVLPSPPGSREVQL